jgi:hypothetical protein
MRHRQPQGCFQSSIAAQIFKDGKKNDLRIRYLYHSVVVTLSTRNLSFPVREFGVQASFQVWDGSCTLMPFIGFILPIPCGPKEAACVGEFILKPGIHVPEASADFLARRFGDWLH